MDCDGCALCCKLLPIPWMNSLPGEWCSSCTKTGCSIYNDNIDEKCKSFECAYSQMENVNIALRPDNCKVVFELAAEKIMFGMQHPDYDLTSIAKGQITSFLREGFSVVIKKGSNNPEIYLAKGHGSQEVYEKIESAFLEKML